MATARTTPQPQGTPEAKPYRVTRNGGRQCFATYAEAKKAAGKHGIIAAWSGTQWIE